MRNAECGMLNGAQAAPAGSGAGVDGKMKPILFSTPMVQAILAGRKTMVRIPIKHQPDKIAIYMGIYCGQARFETDIDMWNMMLPYKPGDVLYVRETWQEVYETEYDIYNPNEPLKIAELIVGFENLPKKCVGLSRECSCLSMPARNKYYVYAASKPEYTSEKYELKWRPSAQMPREAARIFLKVTDVRVEKVQDISNEDVKREGLPINYDLYNDSDHQLRRGYKRELRKRFSRIWDARNAKRGFGWDSNPWVWVIEFERSEGA